METDTPKPVSPLKKLAIAAPVFLFGVAPFACCFASCAGNYAYMITAPPLAKTVALVESNPAVSAAVGGGADVSLVVTRILERDFIQRGGRDRVLLMTTVDGSSGEATLNLDAVNVDGQGWAGTFSVTTQGRQVLRDGSYQMDGGGTVLEGTFAPDGTPLVGD